MKKLGNRYYRCIYVYEFSDNYAYVGLTYNLEKRNKSRKLQNNDAVTKHIEKTNIVPIIKQLSEYVFVDVAIVLENDCIEIYRRNGWKMLNKAKGGAIGSSEMIWSKEKCQMEAFKYNTRSDFYYKSNNIYSAACRYGWLDEICLHMTSKITHWTVKIVHDEALKYNTRYEFSQKSRNAYVWAHRKNILNSICSHMLSSIGSNQYKQTYHG